MSSLSKNSEGKGQGSHKAITWTSHPCDLTWTAFLKNSLFWALSSPGAPPQPSAGKALLNALTWVSVYQRAGTSSFSMAFGPTVFNLWDWVQAVLALTLL